MTPYQKQKQRKRTIASFLAAFLFHIFIFGGFLLYEFLFVEDLSEFSGPVLVKLGEPGGEDIPVLPEEDVPETELPEETVPPSVSSDSVQAPAETPSVPAAEPVSDPSDRPAPAEPLETPATETTAESSSRESEAEAQPAEPAAPQVKIVEGSEAGNSWETRYDSGGLVGRSLGAEIFLYMPLPRYLPLAVFNQVRGDSYSPGISRREFIMRYYTDYNQELVLEFEPVTDDVRAIWSYLIEAGYNLEEAEYKASGYLKPVILSFSISPGGELVNMRVQQSSGDPEVDAAVAEGFQNAAFYNSEDREINGRFTYRFE